MTVEKVIADLDEMLPNTFTTAKKVDWLNEIDKKIYMEIVKKHEGWEDITLATYVAPTTGSAQNMLVPEPYSSLYLYYLMTKVYFFNAEFERYNNTSVVFNQAYAEFVAWYNSNVMPLTENIKYGNNTTTTTVAELDI